jgi:ketosteroid isomerase-like protein
MSRAEVDMLRRGYDLVWREGQIERALEDLPPDFEWVVPDHPDRELSRGPDEVIAFFRDWIASWDELDVSYELREADAGRVLAVITMRGTGRGSGARTEMRMAQLWSFEGGRARRMVAYNDVEEGRAAAGPSRREQLVREAVAVFDRAGPEAILPYLTEDVVWQEDPDWPGGSTYHGHEGVLASLGELLDSMDFESEVEEFVERGDRVLVLMHWTGHGSASGAEVDQRAAVVFTLRDELIAHVRFFFDSDRARATLDAG